MEEKRIEIFRTIKLFIENEEFNKAKNYFNKSMKTIDHGHDSIEIGNLLKKNNFHELELHLDNLIYSKVIVSDQDVEIYYKCTEEGDHEDKDGNSIIGNFHYEEDDPDGYCGACMENPCMCSDPDPD
jgi:hypothetical protein